MLVSFDVSDLRLLLLSMIFVRFTLSRRKAVFIKNKLEEFWVCNDNIIADWLESFFTFDIYWSLNIVNAKLNLINNFLLNLLLQILLHLKSIV